MDWKEPLDRLRFDNDKILNEEVEAETRFQMHTLIGDWKGSLMLNHQATLLKLIFKASFVNRFEEPRSQSFMDFDCRVYDCCCDALFCHSKIFSWCFLRVLGVLVVDQFVTIHISSGAFMPMRNKPWCRARAVATQRASRASRTSAEFSAQRMGQLV